MLISTLVYYGLSDVKIQKMLIVSGIITDNFRHLFEDEASKRRVEQIQKIYKHLSLWADEKNHFNSDGGHMDIRNMNIYIYHKNIEIIRKRKQEGTSFTYFYDEYKLKQTQILKKSVIHFSKNNFPDFSLIIQIRMRFYQLMT